VTHQKTTKSCLLIQGKSIDVFVCEFCSKTKTTKQNLETHRKICKSRPLGKTEKVVGEEPKPKGDVECEFCHRFLKSKKALVIHQKTMKECLTIQGKSIDTFVCKFCAKALTTKQALVHHTEICKTRLDIEAKSTLTETQLLKKRVEKLEKVQEKRVARKLIIEPSEENRSSAYLIDNYYLRKKLEKIPISNIEPLTVSYIEEMLKKGIYTYDLFLSGLNGIIVLMKLLMVSDTGEQNYVRTNSKTNAFYRLGEGKFWVPDKNNKFIWTVLEKLFPFVSAHHDIFNGQKGNNIWVSQAADIVLTDEVRTLYKSNKEDKKIMFEKIIVGIADFS
jgi:hypothetical protein